MSARDFAVFRLDALALPNWRPHTLPSRFEPRPPSDPRDRGLAEQIYVGVLKNLLLLQHAIEHYSGRPAKKIDPAVSKVLAVALYQLLFLSRIPPMAAVNEAVEQTRRLGLGRASGFVNAVLRNAGREGRFALPDPSDARRHAEVALSHPADLYDRLADLYGSATALAVCRHNNREPPLIVRLGRGVRPEQLALEAVSVRPHQQPGFAVVEGATPAMLADWAARGLARVQDPTAGLAVPLLDIAPGMRVLDRCCGVGTKTIQMAEMAGPDGLVVAIDPAAARIHTLRRSLDAAAALPLAKVQTHISRNVPPPETGAPAAFDRVLIDAPCSNSGVLSRRPEARYTQTDASLASLERLVDTIVVDTLPHVARGGLLCYSTCSIWPAENRRFVDRIISRTDVRFELVNEVATAPSTDEAETAYHDGGYACLLRRL